MCQHLGRVVLEDFAQLDLPAIIINNNQKVGLISNLLLP